VLEAIIHRYRSACRQTGTGVTFSIHRLWFQPILEAIMKQAIFTLKHVTDEYSSIATMQKINVNLLKI